jgi:hypothetical protein
MAPGYSTLNLRGTPGSLPKLAGDCQMKLLITGTDPFTSGGVVGVTFRPCRSIWRLHAQAHPQPVLVGVTHDVIGSRAVLAQQLARRIEP